MGRGSISRQERREGFDDLVESLGAQHRSLNQAPADVGLDQDASLVAAGEEPLEAVPGSPVVGMTLTQEKVAGSDAEEQSDGQARAQQGNAVFCPRHGAGAQVVQIAPDLRDE